MSENKKLDLGEFIREQRRMAEMSLRKLSEVAGISNPYLSQIERGLRKPSADILQQIARGLSISAETLYVQAGILDERSERSDLVAAIRSAARFCADRANAIAPLGSGMTRRVSHILRIA